MMKLLNKIPNSSFLRQTKFPPQIFRVLSFSTQAAHPDPSTETLYTKLQRCTAQKVSTVPVLEKWVSENGSVNQKELRRIIKVFRKGRGFKPALQIAEWMSMKALDITPEHISIQLDLISKVHGLEQAEIYFNSLESSLKVLPVYGTLLNCYVNAKSIEKAEALVEEIRKLDFGSNIQIYNNMLRLYSQTGEHQKLNSLVQEMEDKGIAFNEYSYSFRLYAFVDSSDVENMENLLRKMEADPRVTANFFTYAIAAKGYLKAGDLEKAFMVTKKCEDLIIKGTGRNTEYESLMTTYAAMQKKDEVYRIWDLLKKSGKVYNREYITMLHLLDKMDDVDGAEKIFAEWEGKNKSSDIRVPNVVISSYCKKGRVREAEFILSSAVEKGMKPSASTWSHMALGYQKDGMMDKAVEMTKKAFLASFPGWKCDIPTVAACLEYLKTKGDVEGTQELLMLLEKCGMKEIVEKAVSDAKPTPEALEVGV